jgi:electron-transferring-flavoprotein dehydrogenase
MDPNLVLIGMVVGLDYQNPHLSPYQEFQRWKHHPEVAKYLEGGRCISYGARALNEGGYHAIPKLTFPGGAILGCSAGFLNSVKIKGSHTAIKSGIVAAEAVHELLEKENENSEENMVPQMSTFQEKMENSWVYDELKEVRNCHGCFEHGLLPGLIYAGASAFVLKGKEPWTFHNKKHDHEKTLPASQCEKIIYPKPDGKLSFDLLSNLTRSGTGHVDDQPVHLTIKPGHETTSSTLSYPIYSGPEQLFCPAGVYGYTDPDDEGKRELTISAPNCLHCKTCDIKTPANYIKWVVPEGGGGPQYTDM